MGQVQVKVDVLAEIKATESSIASLKQQMAGLVPNTAAWKELNKQLQTMQKNLTSMQTKGSGPLTSKKDINDLNKYASNIETAMLRARTILQDVKLGDLKLKPDQIAQLDEFENQLKELEQNYKNTINAIRTTTLNEDFSKNLGKLFDGKQVKEILKQDFDGILQTLDIKKQELEQKQAQVVQDLSKFKGIEGAIKQKNLLETFRDKGIAGLGGTDLEKFFTSKGALVSGAVAKGRVGATDKKQIVDQLLNSMGLNLSEAEVANLMKEKTTTIGNAIQKILQEQDISKFLPKTAQGAGFAQQATQFLELSNKTKEYSNLLQILGNLQQTAANGEQQITEKTLQHNNAAQNVLAGMEDYNSKLLSGFQKASDFGTKTDQLTSRMAQFRETLQQTSAQFMKLQRSENTLNSIKMTITNFMGFYQVLNLVKRAVSEATNHIKELDTVMNGIAIVSNMNTSDLWNQIDSYSKLAQQYGVSIKGAYEVSKIYYQAGYETADVMTLMNETLKLSKISGLDYATTTNYMMTATRGFHMEVSQASTVVDVYSNLAAHTAVSQQELAEAMSRTASSLEGVGMSFQEASAMIATMEAATRETAYSIGTALKSIASRYGELKKDPLTLVDEEGEALSFNKVDDALQSVGISLKDTQGQFRNMTDVILELSDIWDTLETNQQRYIATQFAGNRSDAAIARAA